ncbi:fimbrial protein [Providencia rustigianii DSM 4541]|uniref:Fimbrial protein n=2 Tax=Providencia rustigianii TaxID=158850 RepID=D1P165_9GAMM|nr:fimbrial protein [Providencia rustigianii DSM 4541]
MKLNGDIFMISTIYRWLYQEYTIGALCLVAVLPAVANDNRYLFRPTDGWEVDGQHGVIHVSGSLTENPCELAMESSNQSVSLGNISFSELNHSERTMQPVPFKIELLNCLQVQTELQNFQTGQSVWSSTQPAVKVKFLAASVPENANIIRINGAHGFGLQVANSAGQMLPIGKASNPTLISSGQNSLIYYVSAIRTSGPLIPGAFSALIAFEMLYD